MSNNTNLDNLENFDLQEESESEFEKEEESEVESESESENLKNVEVIIEKKKRGRKPKPKSDIVVEEKIPKQRGRKKIIKEIVEEDKVPKKRGRRPKEKVYSVKELPKTFFEENKNETLILHLPIKLSDKTVQKEPDPNNNNMDYSLYNDDNSILGEIQEDINILPTQKNLMEKKYSLNLFEDDYYEFNNKEDLLDKNISEINNNNNNNNNNISDKDNEYTELKKNKENNGENNGENSIEDREENIKPNKVIKKNLRNILYEFINANNEKTWPESTNIHCWWCCHQFTNTPCALPEYYKKDKFYVSGCFCSFNCCASYNFSKNDDNIWERFSLLNLLYKKLYNQKFVKISLAPPRETLKIFGGYLSIEEFREVLIKNEKTYSVVKPPLISIIPKIEENISQNVKSKNGFPLVNENILNKTQNSLKLKRNKPVTNPNNTLQSFMDLKIL